ncbi:MAG: TrbI/VirB10 family protein [Sphingomicrobium sp.]
MLIVKRPAVAQATGKTPVALIATTFATLGLGVFMWLSAARAAEEQQGASLPPLAAVGTAAPPSALKVTTEPVVQASVPSGFSIPNSGPVTLVATQPTRMTGFEPALTRPVATDPMRERLRSPTLVVDMAQADPQRMPGSVEIRSDSGIGSTSTTVVAPLAAPVADRNLSDTERFASRVGKEEVQVAQAQRMTGLDRLVPQGAVLGAVMETALNSDQPGFARAMIQRDVRSFDGTAVLIPAGSRVIGQYKSGVAQGASRVFVLWTRLIRPDGVSIELASPATDDLGRGGIGGKVNRHFLQRFGGAILTTVLSAGVSAYSASRSGGSTIFVGSAGEAASLAGQATGNSDIPPTITTRQGAAVRIFVARDLDFSGVGPAR